jgi:hypothetical protein
MRRSLGTIFAAATISLIWLSPPVLAQTAPAADRAVALTGQGGAQATGTAGQEAGAAPEKVTFTGDVVLWAFTVHADKTKDFEQVVAKLKAALTKLDRPETRQQLQGWKVIRNTTPQGDGSVLYIHLIDPVVPGADYSITNIVYEAFTEPDERIAFYNMYSGAIKSAFFTIQAPVVNDLSK